MSQREGFVHCEVCAKLTPKAFADRHHVTPQAVGKQADNSDENLIWLCSGCHQNLHSLAHFLMKGRTTEAKDLAESWYTNTGAVRKVLNFASHVVKEMIAMREGERELPEEVRITITVPRRTYTLLRLMSLEKRGHRQFTPFVRDHLAQIASKYEVGFKVSPTEFETTDFD